MIPLPLSSYRTRSNTASTSRLVNCYVEAQPEDAPYPYILKRAPGINSLTTVGTGPIQGIHSALGSLWVVSGGKLYSVTSSLTVSSSLGDVGGEGSEIDIDSNEDTVVVVAPPYAYKYPTFAQITDADFTALGAGDVEFLDNYLLFREPGSNVFFGSDLASATSYDALNFASAEGAPDELVGMKVDHRQVILFGETSTEIWENTGIPGFPFERAINGFIEQGCLNGKTIAKLDQSVVWLANDYTIRRLEGATPVRISTHAVEQFLRSATLISGRAWAYSFEGHIFYEISFDEGTWVFDATTGLWHEKQSYGMDYWKWGHYTEFGGRMFCGDRTGNTLAMLDPETYDEDGEPLLMEWTYQPIRADGARAFHDRLEIGCETGVGLATGQGSDPQLLLEVSDDGGRTWRSMPSRSLGGIGEYSKRVVWHALGSSQKDRVYRGRVSDPVRVTVTSTQTEVRGGRV